MPFHSLWKVNHLWKSFVFQSGWSYLNDSLRMVTWWSERAFVLNLANAHDFPRNVLVFQYWPFQGGTSVVVPYCYLFLLSVFILWFTYYVSDIFYVSLGNWMNTCLGKSCSFGLPRVPFVNCYQCMYLAISFLVLRVGYRIWLYQFLIIAYLFTLKSSFKKQFLATKASKNIKKQQQTNKKNKQTKQNKKKQNKKKTTELLMWG